MFIDGLICLRQYNFSVKYHLDKLNQLADCLSWALPDKSTVRGVMSQEEHNNALTDPSLVSRKSLLEALPQHVVLQEVLRYVRQGWPKIVPDYLVSCDI